MIFKLYELVLDDIENIHPQWLGFLDCIGGENDHNNLAIFAYIWLIAVAV